MSKLDLLMKQIENEFGADLLSTNIVGMDGLSIAGGSQNPDYDSTAISAHFAKVMNLAKKVSDKLGIGQVVDELITTDKSYIIARLLGNGEYYWALVVSRNEPLGHVTMVMNEFSPQIWDAIPH